MNLTLHYYHTLDLRFSSAQTLQVIRDYAYLSKYGYTIHLYGFYKEKKSLKEIQDFLKNFPKVYLHSTHKNSFSSLRLTYRLYTKLLREKDSWLITRHYRKLLYALRIKRLLSTKIIHEMHEESFVYRFKSISKEDFSKTISQTDLIIFTNPSQILFYKKEFKEDPSFRYAVLPNGVELDKFSNALFKDSKVLTYIGQFNRWKNPELLFKTLAKLPKKFTLRVAGGKNNEDSRAWIKEQIEKYNLKGRVDFRGYIPNNLIVKEVINGSNILLLPLGDNLQSCYLTSPMKLFEYLATTIPILSVRCPSVSSLVDEDTIFFSTHQASDFAKAIIDISSIPQDELKKRREKMLQTAKTYSYENRSKKFHNILQNLLKD